MFFSCFSKVLDLYINLLIYNTLKTRLGLDLTYLLR